MSTKKIILNFLFFNLITGVPFGLILVVKHPERAGNSFIQGIEAGFFFSLFFSILIIIRILSFRKKWFHFSNITSDLQHLNIESIEHESLAVDASDSRSVVGGLFLSTDRLVFIPHRFASGRAPIEILLKNISSVAVEGVDLLKFFSGGLRKRLAILTSENLCYQFGVWDTAGWCGQINSMLKDVRIKSRT